MLLTDAINDRCSASEKKPLGPLVSMMAGDFPDGLFRLPLSKPVKFLLTGTCLHGT
jgi:hypothetical protein